MPAPPDRPLEGLPPVHDAQSRVLVLGSMPSARSLELGQYYGNPRNAFWPIAAEVCGFAADLDYAGRTEALRQRGIALWDTVHRCRRRGSADAAIRDAEPNDFGAFFAAHPDLHRVCFNGRTAAQLFERLVRPALGRERPELVYLTLPSTSPAHAALPLCAKLEAWRAALADQAYH